MISEDTISLASQGPALSRHTADLAYQADSEMASLLADWTQASVDRFTELFSEAKSSLAVADEAYRALKSSGKESEAPIACSGLKDQGSHVVDYYDTLAEGDALLLLNAYNMERRPEEQISQEDFIKFMDNIHHFSRRLIGNGGKFPAKLDFTRLMNASFAALDDPFIDFDRFQRFRRASKQVTSGKAQATTAVNGPCATMEHGPQAGVVTDQQPGTDDTPMEGN
jgi:hypothetical protein